MILFFYGPEALRPQQKILAITRRFLDKNPSGAGLERFDCANGDEVDVICQAIPAASLFTARRLIILTNLFSLPAIDQRKLADVLEQIDADTVFIVHEPTNPRKNSVLFRMLLKAAHQQQHFDLLTGQALEQWVVKYLAKMTPSIAITRDALLLLTMRTSDNLYHVRSELDKLSTATQDRKITKPLVELLVVGGVAGDMFATVEAITTGNSARALNLLENQLLSGDDAHKIFAMYVYQVCTLLSVGSFVWTGNRDSRDIAKRAKLHPFVVSKIVNAVQILSRDRIMQWHHQLAEYDRAIKIGQRDIVSSLTLFVTVACSREI